MRFCYADPPYIGMAKKFYSHDPRCAEVDHQDLIDRMCNEFDGWALSLTSTTLKTVLPMCPDKVRVMAWVKPFCAFKKNVNPAYAWEPVIVWGGRKRSAKHITVRDWIACNITLRRGLVGAKPEEFCMWVFDVLGMEPEDEFIDMFPGSGAVTRAHEKWKQQPMLAMDFSFMESTP